MWCVIRSSRRREVWAPQARSLRAATNLRDDTHKLLELAVKSGHESAAFVRAAFSFTNYASRWSTPLGDLTKR